MPARQKITCVGGIALNRKYTVSSDFVMGTSNPARGSQSHGGVVRNIAENLARLKADVSLLSVVGDDESGRELISAARKVGIDTSQITLLKGRQTAEYIAIFDAANELIFGLASMDILDEITSDLIEKASSHISASDWVVIDCNLPSTTIETILQLKRDAPFKIAVDPVSVSKAKRLPEDLSNIDFLFPNRDEALAILGRDQASEDCDAAKLASMLRNRGAKGVVVTDGEKGHVVDTGDTRFRTPALPVEVVNVSGAGDALVAGFVQTLGETGSIVHASKAGAALSALTIESAMDVRPDLDIEMLNAHLANLDRK